MSIRDKALAKTPKRRPQIEVASAKTPHAVAADDSRPAKSQRYPSEGPEAKIQGRMEIKRKRSDGLARRRAKPEDPGEGIQR